MNKADDAKRKDDEKFIFPEHSDESLRQRVRRMVALAANEILLTSKQRLFRTCRGNSGSILNKKRRRVLSN